MAEPIKEHVTAELEDALGKVKSPERSNSAHLLHEIYLWQEIKAEAERKLKESWEAAVEAELIVDDEAMRDMGKGERIMAKTKAYCVVATISDPSQRFDLSVFIGKLARKFKLPMKKLLEMAEASKVAGTASLTKRVREM